MNTWTFWRIIRYFKIGMGEYVLRLFTVGTFLLTSYEFLIARIPVLQNIFPNIFVFGFCGVFVIVPLGVSLGFFHYKRSRAKQTEAMLESLNNPIALTSLNFEIDTLLKICEKLGVEPDPYFFKYRDFLVKHWKELKWYV